MMAEIEEFVQRAHRFGAALSALPGVTQTGPDVYVVREPLRLGEWVTAPGYEDCVGVVFDPELAWCEDGIDRPGCWVRWEMRNGVPIPYAEMQRMGAFFLESVLVRLAQLDAPRLAGREEE